MFRFSIFLLFICFFYAPSFAQPAGTWKGQSEYTIRDSSGSKTAALKLNRSFIMQINPNGLMSGTSHFNYTPSKNSSPLSFRDNFQGRYDVATKKLIFVFEPIMVFESLPKKKADSIYYSYSVTEVGDSLVMTLEADNKKTMDYTYQAATGSWVIYPLPTLMRISYMKPVTALKFKESDSVAVREKEIQHTIMLDTSFISIDLYDNGEIDHDTVTLLLNGKTIVQSKQLSLKSVSLSLELSKEPAEHVLEMFADNLGSIPPNTALLVLTCKQKRYELNLSSNGKVNGSVKLIVRPGL